MMNLFTAMEVTASGLNAERIRMNALASNLANARTTRTPEGGPYKRIDPVFQAVPAEKRLLELQTSRTKGGVYMVEVPSIRQDPDAPQLIYDPSHPDADEQGFVRMPNVNVVEEMVNLITASRSYEAGVTVMQTLKGMAQSALSIGA
ncbi:MAG TPA: flagellar basal body rod protein FlgC [Polyangiales bacterium]|nr:flagellar basal body rod protein FlgC [Polyangiales bacterium]